MGQQNIEPAYRQAGKEQGIMNDEVALYFDVRHSMFLVCYSTLPCGIMVVRQILALNVRVRILAGQRGEY